uniref:Uncharacterized protein n=1 Tax=Shewanella sp. (strain MR-7) TaxID=60481 RepID=Q0HXH7_SHESR
MKLNDLFIADGIIEHYSFRNNILLLLFKDFRGSTYNLKFSGCTSIEESGSVGFSLCKASSNNNEWIVYDDDDQVLAVTFSSVEITPES